MVLCLRKNSKSISKIFVFKLLCAKFLMRYKHSSSESRERHFLESIRLILLTPSVQTSFVNSLPFSVWCMIMETNNFLRGDKQNVVLLSYTYVHYTRPFTYVYVRNTFTSFQDWVFRNYVTDFIIALC